jgi:hypothetical protein
VDDIKLVLKKKKKKDIKLVLRSVHQWKIGHVKRDANEVAHELAKEASRSSMDNV